MFSWEQATSGFLNRIGLRSIKSKILVFALLATLIPSVSMGWLSYRNNRVATDEKISQELSSLTTHASRELELWFQERRYEMRVLSSSYEVSENLQALTGPGASGAVQRLEDYLHSVAEKFPDYEELVVVEARGRVVASSESRSGGPAPEDSVPGDAVQESTVGDPHWDEGVNRGVMVLSEPIRAADGLLLGAMVAKTNFAGIDRILADYTDPTHELYVITKGGEILASSRELEGSFMEHGLELTTAVRLFEEEARLEFRGFRGAKALGYLREVPGPGWGVVAEKDRAQAYAAIDGLRNVTLGLVATVMLFIGLAAYLLGLTIVTPLRRLTVGATDVAGGNLEVKLPVYGQGEVVYLTGIFNDMVARLRQKNEELEELSATDALTGLYNRTRLPQLMAKELSRSRRHAHSFSILMVDIDHFKQFNDQFGHQAGDDRLVRVAEILKGSVRACDVAARYGGEEFLILLNETDPEGAMCLAENLRRTVEEARSDGEEIVTVSIGAASFPEHGGDVEAVIREADDALYRCKRGGRNRVSLAKLGTKAARRRPARRR